MIISLFAFIVSETAVALYERSTNLVGPEASFISQVSLQIVSTTQRAWHTLPATGVGPYM